LEALDALDAIITAEELEAKFIVDAVRLLWSWFADDKLIIISDDRLTAATEDEATRIADCEFWLAN
jgi:hypothetical protein